MSWRWHRISRFSCFFDSLLIFYDFHDVAIVTKTYYDFDDFHYSRLNLFIDRDAVRDSHIGILIFL